MGVSIRRIRPEDIRWDPPVAGTIKHNLDAFCWRIHHQLEQVVLIRDHMGFVLGTVDGETLLTEMHRTTLWYPVRLPVKN
ncbi:hypothetical protein L484_002534 [Morus notabilis]|uniref:Uncharacterized protein n=1 Tax=Morus notabilis TaxID=981085 RepID=W9R980_9ROSA|nr:hypothetical protein L484_002534 [Morus notabilis]